MHHHRLGKLAEMPRHAAGDDDAREMLRCLTRLEAQLRRSYLESTRALVATVEARDVFTHRHSARVAQISRCIAHRLRLAAAEIECIATAARLHDIGKIGVPDVILNKPGALAPDEFAIVRRHPTIAVEILGHTTYLRRELPLILHHHERIDGGGYPAGLRGDQVPLGARVIAAADALETMVAQRSYKPPMSIAHAREELDRCRGTQFDERVVDALHAWLDDSSDDMSGCFRASVTVT
jgi:HD-GYP domain-containing protein (c-di-GMP phosphodiesterase class II)